MNIFLDAFVDTNFGDVFFVHTLVTRYPDHTFYMIKKSGNEESYQNLKAFEKNICLVDQQDEDCFFDDMDAMMIVGGDIFWDYGDYSVFFERMQKIKEKNGWNAILGISLFEKYSEVTQNDLCRMFSMTDVIVVRDKNTYIQVKKLAPNANVVSSADMAFTFDKSAVRYVLPKKGVLGISVRKKIPRNTEEKYEQYCDGIMNTAVEYLKQSRRNKVVFLALSSGVFDDGEVVERIINSSPEEYRKRMKCVSFNGDVAQYILEMQKCEKMLCTRFHAMAFAIILNKPFVPIVYEEKMKRLLNEIGYYGASFLYEEKLEAQNVLGAFHKNYYSEKEMKWYLEKAGEFFQETDCWLKKSEKKKKIFWFFN